MSDSIKNKKYKITLETGLWDDADYLARVKREHRYTYTWPCVLSDDKTHNLPYMTNVTERIAPLKPGAKITILSVLYDAKKASRPGRFQCLKVKAKVDDKCQVAAKYQSKVSNGEIEGFVWTIYEGKTYMTPVIEKKDNYVFRIVNNSNSNNLNYIDSPFSRQIIKQWFQSLDEQKYIERLELIFGFDLPEDAFKSLRNDMLGDSYNYPEILIINKHHSKYRIMGEHIAAYDYEKKEILVIEEFVTGAVKDKKIANVLFIAVIEEYGHNIDHNLRSHYSTIGGNAPLDEGAVFASHLISEQDLICPNGEFAEERNGHKKIFIDLNSLKDVISIWLSDYHIKNDEKKGSLSFFGGFKALFHAAKWLAKRTTKTLTKHIAKHGRMITSKIIHSVFRKPKEIKKIVTQTVEEGIKLAKKKGGNKLSRKPLEEGGVRVFQEATKTPGKVRYIVEKEFSREIGTKGEKILRVVIDMTGRIVTCFPTDTFKKIGLGIVAINIFTENTASAAEEMRAEIIKMEMAREQAESNRSWGEVIFEFIMDCTIIFSTTPLNNGEDQQLLVIRTLNKTANDIIGEIEKKQRKKLTIEQKQIIYSLIAVAIGTPMEFEDDDQ